MRVLAVLPLLAFATSVGAQTTHVVAVTNTQFSPSTLTIEAGDTVEWQNSAGCHNVFETTASSPAGFGSGSIMCAPWTYSFTFDVPGEYTYLCEAHGLAMTGAVTVVPPTATEDEYENARRIEVAPNPFSGRTAVIVGVGRSTRVHVAVLDVEGREVAVLHEGFVSAERPLETEWVPDAATPAGVYVVRIVGDAFNDSRRVTLVR